jgi:hypothetical protein
MALFFKDKEISSVYFGKQVIAAIYKGGKLLWEAVRSCFGKGYWMNEYPWDNEDTWNNNS